MASLQPRISSWADLSYVSEEFDSDTGLFRYTFFATIDAQDVIHVGQLEAPRRDISFQQVMDALKPVADEILFPPWQPHSMELHEAPTTLSTSTVFIKRPCLPLYDTLAEYNVLHLLPEAFLQEAQTMQALLEHPHPHIIAYHGCRVRRGHIAGIVLERHPHDLVAYFRGNVGKIDKAAFMAALRSAIQHLHALGWAHNDLHPANVMVNEAGMPIVIDFDSARRIGEALGLSRGTKGWIEGDMKDYTMSKAEHDLLALGKIEAWLDEPVKYGKDAVQANETEKL